MPVSGSYTFTNVTENHSIYVSAVQKTDELAPLSAASVAKLIDHLVNGSALDGNYDFNGDGVVDGRDLIVLQATI